MHRCCFGEYILDSCQPSLHAHFPFLITAESSSGPATRKVIGGIGMYRNSAVLRKSPAGLIRPEAQFGSRFGRSCNRILLE